jgi:hypothetical protein
MRIISRIRSWFQGELTKLRPLSVKQRIEYLFSYYTGWFVLFLIGCLFIGYFGDAIVQSRKETVLQGYITNDDLNYFPADDMETEYASHLCLSNQQRIVFDDTLYFDLEGNADEYTAASNGKVIATMAINQLDFMITTLPVLDHFRDQLPMKDLEKFLPPDILTAVQDQLVPGLDENGEEAMVGINMAQSRYLKDLSTEVDFYLFIPYNIPNEEALLAFLRYCFC